MVAAIIRTVFVPHGKRALVERQFDEVVPMLERSHPAAAQMLDEARTARSRFRMAAAASSTSVRILASRASSCSWRLTTWLRTLSRASLRVL